MYLKFITLENNQLNGNTFFHSPTSRQQSYLNVRGHASEDINIDSVMSSSTCNKNSALAHASVADSILLGFSSHDWRDSIILYGIVISINYLRVISICLTSSQLKRRNYKNI